MPASETAQSVEVPLASLVELAIDWWRFERRLLTAEDVEGATHNRYLARRLGKFLSEREISVLDLTGMKYEAGLAVEVLDVLAGEGASEEEEIVDETVSPIVMWRGAVVKHGQVIIRKA